MSRAKVILFKIIQELFHNILKHAEAQMANISISKKDDKIQILVEDNGIGFETDKGRSRTGQTHGFGLFSIRERLDHLGGCFDIQSRPGHGTRITVAAPMQPAV